MDEFSLIAKWFKSLTLPREDVIIGLGDDAACLSLPAGQQLLVSTDTLVAGVHFLTSWDAYDIAYRSVMVNVSDIAAMGGIPCWVSLALTLPEYQEEWMQRFSEGLRDALCLYSIELIGGDTTRGPLSITLTIHGQVPTGQAIRRSGARPGDGIFVSGELGAAAMAVSRLTRKAPHESDAALLQKLLRPLPRVDLVPFLRQRATAMIDVSDGLSADLNHLCVASGVGACLWAQQIPVHSAVKQLSPHNYLDFALSGGDDYELCFTMSPQDEALLIPALQAVGLVCYPIGVIEKQEGLRLQLETGDFVELRAKGYNHFGGG